MTDRNKERLSILGLIMLTIWSALQYIVLANVPDSVPEFAFLCVTSILGFIVLCLTRFGKLRKITLHTLAKGALLALELCGFNFFLLIGSRNTEAVISSSIVSMYFIFVTPLLLILKRNVSFRSVVAGLIGVISLLLLFGADTDILFGSKNVILLFIAAFFFAVYVVSISVVGENEDSSALALCQLICGIVFNFIGWLIQVLSDGTPLTLPTDIKFWVSALFIGVFIRALYSLIQIAAQKNVQPVKASLIFSSEIIITLVLNPVVSRIMGTKYSPITTIQVVGCVLFLIAMLLIDDNFMGRFGYQDMVDVSFVDESGNTIKGSSVSKKTANMTLIISIVAMTLATFICLGAISRIKVTTVENSTTLGQNAAQESETALKAELEAAMIQTVNDKADYANSVLSNYASTVSTLASYAESLYENPDMYSPREAMYPLLENGGIWAMTRCIADNTIEYASLKEENGLLGNMEDLFVPCVENNPNITTVYLGTASGLLVSYDPYSDSAYTGGESYYDYRNSEWYTKGQTIEGTAFTSAYQDGYGRGLTVTCMAPFRDADGSFKGVVAMDILIKNLNSTLVSSGIEEPSGAILLSKEGYVIAGNKVPEDSASSLTVNDETLDSPVRHVADEVLKEKSGLTYANEGNESIYVAYSTIDFTDWKLCITCPVSVVIAPAVRIRASIDNNTEIVSRAVGNGIRSVIENCLILFAVIILAITFIVGKYSQKISQPLKKLEQDVRDISSGDLSLRTDVKTNDEIGSLATTFNSMASSLQDYIVELKDATAKEERIASELAFATQIQASMLPSTFPAFPDHLEFDIFASMKPAKEVGGDFYDFFMTDESHLGIVIADVSGKGVPAALFMVITKTLIKNRALLGGTPAEILSFVNSQLIENNEAEMFVTVWLGILDLKTGKLTASNAGHEFPVIGKAGQKFELVRDRHGFVLAGMEGSKYRDYELQLEPGDRLFIYTDGIPEATDDSNQLFGTDRLLEALNSVPFTSCSMEIENVTNAVNEFVKDAPQFDDMTMLCLDYKKHLE